tara:strand:+ start:2888 stop:3367 length:480 start_codon:yes stop_codon:yes gene_type:complete
MSIFDINLGADISRPETYGGSGKNIYGDKYGKAAESEEKENPLEFKKKQIESTYNYEFTERKNENNLSYMPEMYIENNRLVVKLNDEAEKHANYINMYAAQSAYGQDNRDIVYEIDGKKHAYDFSVFGGTKFTPIEEIENNPFTEGLPEGNQMMPEDFK